MQQKLADFISRGPIECASGGRAQPTWLRRKLMAALAGIGIIGALLFPARLFAEPASPTPSLRLVAEFQEKVNRLPGSATIVILDHNLASSTPLYVETRIREERARRGLSCNDASATAIICKWAGKLFAAHTINSLQNNLRSVVNTNHNMTPEMEWQIAASPTCALARTWAGWRVAETMSIPAGGHLPGEAATPPPLNADILPDFAQLSRFTLYHEAFGHATECTAELASPTTGARHAYQRHLQELRAELAGVAGLACENGNTRMGRLRALMLDAGGPRRILSGQEKYYPYATIGPHLVKACDKMDAILAIPVRAAAFRAMDENALVAFTNRLFDELKPGPAEYAATLRAIAPLARHTARRALRRARGRDRQVLSAFLGRAEVAERILMKSKPPPEAIDAIPVPSAPAPLKIIRLTAAFPSS